MAKETTAVIRCSCKDADQDKIYGLGYRLHNLGQSKGKPNGKAFCTVCCAPTRLVRISFVQPKPNQFGPLDKDPLVKRTPKDSNAGKPRMVVVSEIVKKVEVKK